MINARLFSLVSSMPKVSTDTDAQTFITAASITDATQKNAINQLVLDLKSNSLWTKIKALYPFVGGNSVSHSYNLINPSNYQITWYGGVTHSSTGVTGNGTNGYGLTGYMVATSVSGLTPQNNHVAIYSRVNSSSGYDFYGLASANQLGLISKYTNGKAYYIVDGTYSPNVTNSDSKGCYIGSANSSTTTKLFRNGTNIVSGTTSQSSFTGTAGNMTLFSGDGTYSNRELSFACLGTGLSDSEVSALNTIITTYQTTLSRNV